MIINLVITYLSLGVIALVIFDRQRSLPTKSKEAAFVIMWPLKLLIVAVKSIKIQLHK